MRIRPASSRSRVVRTSALMSRLYKSTPRFRGFAGPGRFRSSRHQNGEGIARLARADANFRVAQPRGGEHPLQLRLAETERSIAELRADPLFLVLTKIQDQNAAAGHRDPGGFGDRMSGVGGVMQSL